MDLDKVIGQRPSIKSGLGYKKSFKTSNYTKSKEKQSQGSNAKIVKSTNAKSFNKKHNYAFQYKQFDKKINKEKKKFQSNNAIFFNPSWSNKLYFKGPDGWFYEFKNQNNFQTKSQRYEHKRVVSQKHKNISKKNPRLKIKD
jgi:replication fork clamp-binding protein CrfC